MGRMCLGVRRFSIEGQICLVLLVSGFANMAYDGANEWHTMEKQRRVCHVVMLARDGLL